MVDASLLDINNYSIAKYLNSRVVDVTHDGDIVFAHIKCDTNKDLDRLVSQFYITIHHKEYGDILSFEFGIQRLSSGDDVVIVTLPSNMKKMEIPSNCPYVKI